MISADFEYDKAHSIGEAMEMYEQLQDEGKSPLFYNGGTEIITLMRVRTHYTGRKALIDIKSIPECKVNDFEEDYLVIGSSIPLAKIEEMSAFPLLGKNCSRIADHTSREKITLGGNVCGHIAYKEAVLPLLLTNCDATIADKTGLQTVPIQQMFDQEIKLASGSFITQFKVKKRFLDMPFVSKKVTRVGRIGYPLLTVSGLQTENEMRFAFSGLCAFPFRSSDMEETLNQKDKSVEERITSATRQVPAPILNDMDGSAAYRKFVLRNVLEECIAELNRSEKA